MTTTVPSLALPQRVESPWKGFQCVRTCRNASKHERHILVGVFFVFRGHLSQPVTASTKTSLCGRHVFMFEGPFSTYAPEQQKPAQPVQWVWVWGGTWTQLFLIHILLFILYCNSLLPNPRLNLWTVPKSGEWLPWLRPRKGNLISASSFWWHLHSFM